MSWSPIWATALFSALQGAAAYGLFEYWRHQENKQTYYQPRRKIRPHRTPAAPELGLLSWIQAINKVNDDELHRSVGMDHYVLLRFMQLGMKLTGMPSLIGVLLMVLVYRTGGNGQEEFNELTMSNVQSQSRRLWFSVAFFYLVVGWALFLFWREWENFVPKRFMFLAEGDPDMDREVVYATMVENIPESKRSSPALYGYFDTLFSGKISYASLCMASGDLESILEDKQEALKKIEHAVAQKHLDTPKVDTTKVGGVLCCGGSTVITEDYYRDELETILDAAGVEHARISRLASEGPGSKVASSTGFVTFTSVSTKLTAVEVNLSGKRYDMDALAAPAPDDVLWQNVTVPAQSVAFRKILANCFWTLGIVTWAVPVLFVQSIADLDQLVATLDWLNPWTPDTGSFLYGLIAGLLPVVALSILTALVPIVIRLSAIRFVRMKSEAEVDMYVFKWHFGFQVANLWLTIIGGSILNELDAFVEDYESIIDLLGVTVPGKAEFFMNILLVTLLAGLGMDISRVVSVIVGYVTGAMSDRKGKSDRELREADAPPSLDWGTFYPPLLFVLMVVFSYASIAPLILPVAYLLFHCGFLVYKNQSLYLYVQKSECGGAAMYPLFNFSMATLYVGEVVFFAFIGIKEGTEQGPVSLILIFITMVWHYIVHHKFVSISKTQSMQAAVAADSKLMKTSPEHSPSSTAENAFDSKAYVQSCLKKSEWETQPEGYRNPANALKAKTVEPRREHVLERGIGVIGGV